MQRLDVSGAVRPIYGSSGVKRLMGLHWKLWGNQRIVITWNALLAGVRLLFIMNPMGGVIRESKLSRVLSRAYSDDRLDVRVNHG